MWLYSENKSTINIAHNLEHDKIKHIEKDRHFIKEKLNIDIICTSYVSSQRQFTYIYSARD